MGFGILLFGYFITFLMSLNAYGAIFALIGNYVIFIALQKLSEYKHSLSRCIPFLLIMFLCNLVGVVRILLPAELGLLGTVTDTVSLVASLLFNIFLFLSIISLGNDTEVDEVKSLAKTNISVVCVYFVSNLAMILFIGNKYILVAAMIFRLLFPLFALALIYRCFRFICAPEDVDMPVKPSRFKFINDFRERQTKKEEEAKKAREEILKKNETSSNTHAKKHKNKK